MGPIDGWGNVWGTSVTVPVTISTSLIWIKKKSTMPMGTFSLFTPLGRYGGSE